MVRRRVGLDYALSSHDRLGSVGDDSQAISRAERVAREARRRLPRRVAVEDGTPYLFFAAAAMHAVRLLKDEVSLARDGRWSNIRILGRSLTEAWLWGNCFLLGGEEAVERFISEDAHHQGRLAFGWDHVVDQLPEVEELDLDIGEVPTLEDVDEVSPNVRALAEQVGGLREAAGIAGGVAVAEYEVFYRWESANAVHTTFDLLARYLDPGMSGGPVSILSQPAETDFCNAEGPRYLLGDARKVADLVLLLERHRGEEPVTEVSAALGVSFTWTV